MSILKETAGALRAHADRLDSADELAPQSAEQLIRRHLPPNSRFAYQQRIMLEYANNLDFVQSCVKAAGVTLGVEIGKKLRAEFTGLRLPDHLNPYCPLVSERSAEYRADVYVLTPAQLEKLVEIAYRAGKQS